MLSTEPCAAYPHIEILSLIFPTGTERLIDEVRWSRTIERDEGIMAEPHEQSSAVSTRSASPRLSYTSAISDTPLLGLPIGDMFDQTVERYPDNPALIVRQQQIRLTYRELQAEVNRCARALLHLGLTKGQRLAIWSPNRAEWCITQFATSKIALIHKTILKVP